MRASFAGPAQGHNSTGRTGQRGWFDRSDSVPCPAAIPDPGVLAAQLREASRRGEPFVLLDDQLTGRAALFTEPRRVFRAETSEEVGPALAAMRSAADSGATLAGFLSYTAGASLQPVAVRSARPLSPCEQPPLLWFAEFGKRAEGWLGDCDGPRRVAAIQPLVRRGQYEARVAAAIERIRAGDIYQVNLTFPALVDIGNPLPFYYDIRRKARAPFGAFIQLPGRQILSFSPELFFHTEADSIWARPMKGTRPRGRTEAADSRQARALSSSAKDRAENMMIVDLLRNDLSPVCEAGSVEVPSLFELETYPTVWQMTSTIRGRLRAGTGAVDALAALFPCGSITGAPKIMAMRVIDELETFDRGIYTGGIGTINATTSTFSVAIRTIDHAGGRGRLDLGAGIVADSRPRAEWLECLAKARFLTH